MGARNLLADLTGAGMSITADGDRLVIRPASMLSDNMRAALREAKPELLALLSVQPFARTCAACTHRLPCGTCGEPVTAGLAKHHAIRWAPAEHARTCAGFTPKPAAAPESRPHKLPQAEADRCHARPWDEAACARFAARVSRFLRVGIDATDADDLAERQHLHDIDGDGLGMCGECSNLAGHASTGWRCRAAGAAGVATPLPAELVVRLQRCPAFAETNL